MSRLTGLPPIVGVAPRVLVLGSMPGVASLAAQQYYAHPQNAFWKILATILGMPADAGYAQRVAALQSAPIALWDVVHACVRAGSLDADIEPGSVEANDFAGFFRSHRGIVRVCFNGAAAERLFRRHVLPTLAATPGTPREYLRLPSTSPAHAALSYERKLAAWRAALTVATAT